MDWGEVWWTKLRLMGGKTNSKKENRLMDAYSTYLMELKATLSTEDDSKALSSTHSACKANAELRRLVPLERLREAGAFFTSVPLAQEALKYIANTLDDDSVVLDPTCGAGELLILCAIQSPSTLSLPQLLRRWTKNYIGRDLHESFVEVAKLRLLYALAEHNGLISRISSRSLTNLKSNIVAKSIFEDLGVVKKASHIVVNPPYTMIAAPEECKWSSGRVNAAAVFLDAVIQNAKPGTRIAAILPEVLRSGARYGKWRGFVSKRCHVERVRTWGRFDEHTDVHVFMLDCVIKDERTESSPLQVDWVSAPESANELNDYFDISVGPVVHYRDPHKGHWKPYLISKGLPVWETIDKPAKNRRYQGRTILPPFVVVRRVSRPEDAYRARPTIITGQRDVAVDNHLLVLKPKNGSLAKCKQLLTVLKDERTNEWLNQRIRCRHLTVGAMKKLPWWGCVK